MGGDDTALHHRDSVPHGPPLMDDPVRVEVAFDIRTIRELPGHKSVIATTIYTHVLNKAGRSVRSPADELRAVLYSLYKTSARLQKSVAGA